MHHDKHHDSYVGKDYMAGHTGKSVLPFVVGIAATVLVGGYVLFGPEGRRNRRNVDRYIKRAKYQILDKMEHLEDVTEDQYHKIVDEVMAKYGSVKEIGGDKWQLVSDRFKDRWNEMREAAREARDDVKRELEEAESSIRNQNAMKRRKEKDEGMNAMSYPTSQQPTNPPSVGGGETPEGQSR